MLAAVLAPRAVAKDNAAEADKLFSGREIPHLIIRIADEEMDILRDQKRQNGKTLPRTNVLVTVRDGASFYTNVALHLKGSASFRGIDSKPALTLNFDKYDEKQRFRGLQKISLNNSMHDPTFLCEKLGRDIYAAAGIPVPRVAHATVELNGRDLGVYVLAEGWNKQFLKRHFRDADGNFYERTSKAMEVTMPLELKSGDRPEDHRALKALAEAVEEKDPTERWRKLEQTLDVDQFITAMAIEIMIGHWDGYCRNRNNFRVFHDRPQDRMVFLPHGMDQLFGMRRSGGNDMPVLGTMRGLAAIAVIEAPEGCRRYVKRMDEMLERYFNVAEMTNRVLETSARLRPFLESDPGMLETNQTAVARLLERIPQRREMMRAQLTALQTPLPVGQKESIAIERWELKRDSGSPSLTKSGRGILQITGNGSSTCVGSWRAVFLLESGRYRLQGDVSVEQARRNDDREGLAVLRTSLTADGATASLSQTSTNLIHEFSVFSRRYVEMVCEYRGNGGKALFDGESITLSRLDGASARSTEVEQSVIKKPE